MFRQLFVSVMALGGLAVPIIVSEPAAADDVVYEGPLESIDVRKAKITVDDGIELSVVPKTKIQIDGKPAQLKDIKVDQQATIDYDDDLAVVRSITLGAANGNIPRGKKGPKIDLNLLREKVRAIRRFDPKTLSVRLEYRFENPAELKDFVVGGKPPTLADGVLTIPSNTDITHVVSFKGVKIQALYIIDNMTDRRALISCSGGITLEYHKPGRPTRFFLSAKEQKLSEAVVKEGGWPRQISLAYAPNLGTVDVKIADDPLSGKVNFAELGAVTFHGGSGGIRIASLTIEGVPTNEWIQGLLPPPPPTVP